MVWRGSRHGKAKNRSPDFVPAHQHFLANYSSGTESTEDESEFETRVRRPREAFERNRLMPWERVFLCRNTIGRATPVSFRLFRRCNNATTQNSTTVNSKRGVTMVRASQPLFWLAFTIERRCSTPALSCICVRRLPDLRATWLMKI